MMPFPSWLQETSERRGRLGTSLGVAIALGILSVSTASVIILSPRVASLMAAIIAAFFLIEHVLPPSWATSATLTVLFVTSGDTLLGFSDQWIGLFVLAAGTFLGTVTLLHGRFRVHRRTQLALPGLAAMYILFYAVHVSKGSLRGGTFWIAAVGLWIWLDGRIAADPVAARRGIENGIILIGAISGGIGLAEFFGVVDPTQWIPGLKPSEAIFSQEIGRRVAGLSGHPLCLGTLCMLGCALSIIRLVLERRQLRNSPWIVGGVIASGAGLIFSGARGSWLALLCGLALAFAATIQSRRVSGTAVIRGSLLVGAIAGLAMVSSLGFIVRERLVGTASTPGSFGQRVVALQTIVDSIQDLPLLGAGPGGVDEFMVRSGALVPNIENEYLIALVSGGPLAMIALLAFSLLTIRIAFREAIATRDPGPLALCVGLSVNIATFNMFSWSLGPSLFATVTCLAVLQRRHSLGSSGDPRA